MKRNSKKTLCERLRVPKRLRGTITRDELERVAESESVDRIAAEAENARYQKRLRSEKFDPRRAIAAFLVKDDIDLGSVLCSLVAASIPSDHCLDISASLMRRLKPRNLLECLLLSQMSAVHVQGLKELSRAANTEDADYADRHTNRAARLMRVFIGQLEALELLRAKGKAKQRIEVRHVSVVAGQAVVGVGLREGAEKKNEQ